MPANRQISGKQIGTHSHGGIDYLLQLLSLSGASYLASAYDLAWASPALEQPAPPLIVTQLDGHIFDLSKCEEKSFS